MPRERPVSARWLYARSYPARERLIRNGRCAHRVDRLPIVVRGVAVRAIEYVGSAEELIVQSVNQRANQCLESCARRISQATARHIRERCLRSACNRKQPECCPRICRGWCDRGDNPVLHLGNRQRRTPDRYRITREDTGIVSVEQRTHVANVL